MMNDEDRPYIAPNNLKGELYREAIEEAIHLDPSAEAILHQALYDAQQGHINPGILKSQFDFYLIEKKFSHCHFMALLMSKIDMNYSVELFKQNADYYIVSKYVLSKIFLKCYDIKSGIALLQEAAEEGHFHAKRDLLFLDRSLSGRLYFLPRFIFLLCHLLTVAYSDPSSLRIKKRF